MDDKDHLGLLKQKLDALTKILEATRLMELTEGEVSEDDLEREVELFASLYEQRAEVIAKIQKMDEALARYKGESPASEKITGKIRDTAKAIFELDKKHIAASERLKASLSGNLKKIRDGRDVSNAYYDDGISTSGHYFDRTN